MGPGGKCWDDRCEVCDRPIILFGRFRKDRLIDLNAMLDLIEGHGEYDLPVWKGNLYFTRVGDSSVFFHSVILMLISGRLTMVM